MLNFPLAADVVPVNLDFSAEDLHFQFGLDNWDNWVEKVGARCPYMRTLLCVRACVHLHLRAHVHLQRAARSQ